MIRYYSNTDNVRYARNGTTIDDILRELNILTWDAKKHKHSFVGIASEADCRRFVFETPEHEREFLDFHPDATVLRTAYDRCRGYNVMVKIEIIDYEELPIYKKGNRWLWKKG